jgi:hypothetical protein
VVSWPALTDAGVNQGGYLEVAFLDATQTADFQIVRADTLTSHTLYGLRVGFSYVLKVRAVNGSNVRSDWSAQVVHSVDGPRALTTYRQTTAPSSGQLQDGDLWYDTDDGNKLYRYASGSWVAVPLGTGALDTDAATSVVAVEQATGSASWTRPGIGFNAVYRAVVEEISWTNSTGATVRVECSVDYRAVRTSGAGSVYLIAGAGTASTSSAALTDDGGVLTGSTPNADGTERLLVRNFSRNVSAGATFYLSIQLYITTAAGTTTAASYADANLRIVAIKR